MVGACNNPVLPNSGNIDDVVCHHWPAANMNYNLGWRSI